jgi:hypothetical protein
MARIFLLPLLSIALSAQTAYAPNGPGTSACPRIEEDPMAGHGRHTGGSTGGQSVVGGTLYTTIGTWYFKPEERKDVTRFAAYDEKGKPHPLSALKGKLLVIGFWQTNCDPSTRMLMEFGNLAPQAERLGIEVVPVAVDEGRWRVLGDFRRRNADFFKALPIYTAGLGKEGPNAFMDIIPSLPALFVVDEEGKLAWQAIGYKPGMVAQAVNYLKREQAVLRQRQALQPNAPAPEPSR